MQTGTTAAWLAMAGGIAIALIGWLSSRSGVLLNRRTELDKIYMERLKIVEGQKTDLEHECDRLRAELQAVQQSNLDYMIIERQKRNIAAAKPERDETAQTGETD